MQVKEVYQNSNRTSSNGHCQRVWRKWDFPQCFGAIDGSHIPIIAPTHSPTDYYIVKGSVHDARILWNSEVYQKGESGTLVPSHIRTLGGIPVPVVILGDPAYPLLPWLLEPYQGVDLSDKQKKFNRSSCGGWMHIRKIERSVEVSGEKKRYEVGLLVYCCYCALHLAQHLWGAPWWIFKQWLHDVDESSIPSSSGSTLPSTSTGGSIRNALANYFDGN